MRRTVNIIKSGIHDALLLTCIGFFLSVGASLGMHYFDMLEKLG